MLPEGHTVAFRSANLPISAPMICCDGALLVYSDPNLSAGYQFQTLCTPLSEQKATGIVPGYFTAVSRTIPLPDGQQCVLILLGEIDCKDRNGSFVELKCKKLGPGYWPLSPDERFTLWAASELNLVKLIARGHQNKFTDELDMF